MMAPASVPAATATVQVALFRHATKFQGLADVLRHGLLHFLHVLLRIKEPAGHGVLKKILPKALEFANLTALQRKSSVLFFLEQLAFHHEGIVLAARGGIGHKRVDPLAQSLEFRLIENGLAQFLRLLNDRAFFNLSLHNFDFPLPDVGWFVFNASIT